MTSAQAKAKFKQAAKKAKTLYKSGRYNKFSDAVKAAYKTIGSTATSTKANTTGNRTKTGTKTITAHVKIGRAKKKYRQTGTSNRTVDKKIHAKRPGKRRSASGRIYTERRKNRSDMPGKLTGTAYNEMVIRNLHNDNNLLKQAITKLDEMKWQYKKMARGPEKNTLKRLIKDQGKYISSKRKSLTMLKRLIK